MALDVAHDAALGGYRALAFRGAVLLPADTCAEHGHERHDRNVVADLLLDTLHGYMAHLAARAVRLVVGMERSERERAVAYLALDLIKHRGGGAVLPADAPPVLLPALARQPVGVAVLQ